MGQIMRGTQPRHGYCPSCKSGYIRHPYKIWVCKTCGHNFAEPLPLNGKESSRSAGSGQIAPRTYRMQLALETLARNQPAIRTGGRYYGKASGKQGRE